MAFNFRKIKDIATVIFWGFIIAISILFCTFVFLRFLLTFKLISLVILLIISVVIFVKLRKFKSPMLWLIILVRILFYYFSIIGLLGFFWLFITEDFYLTNVEFLFFTFFSPVVIIATILYELFRLIWFNSKTAESINKHLQGIKFLLGFDDN